MALPDCPRGEAEGALDRLLGAVPQQQTCSVGYATWDRLETAAQLMERADRALYAAKRAGRNQTMASSAT